MSYSLSAAVCFVVAQDGRPTHPSATPIPIGHDVATPIPSLRDSIANALSAQRQAAA